MENGGNKKVNLIFEANLNNNTTKPSNTASGPVRERFIRDKYERRKFYDPNAFALVDGMMMSGAHPSSAAGEQQQVIAGVQITQNVTGNKNLTIGQMTGGSVQG